jgi:hypothetical protein
MNCGNCKHWKREEPATGFGICGAIPNELDAPWRYAPCAEAESLKEKTLAYMGYDVVEFITRPEFGCVLFLADDTVLE